MIKNILDFVLAESGCRDTCYLLCLLDSARINLCHRRNVQSENETNRTTRICQSFITRCVVRRIARIRNEANTVRHLVLCSRSTLCWPLTYCRHRINLFSFPYNDRHLVKYLHSIFFTCCLSILRLYRFEHRQFSVRIFSFFTCPPPCEYISLSRAYAFDISSPHPSASSARELSSSRVRYELPTSTASLRLHSHIAILRHGCFSFRFTWHERRRTRDENSSPHMSL